MLNNVNCEACIGFTPDSYALFLCQECVPSIEKLGLPIEIETMIKAYIAVSSDIFSVGELRCLSTMIEDKLVKLLLVGCGKGKECKPDKFRIAAGEAVRYLQKEKVSNVALCAPILGNPSRAHYLQAIVEGLYLGAYSFDKYKSDIKSPQEMLIGIKSAIDEADTVIKKAEIIAEAVCYARDLVNEPGNVVCPEVMANYCQESANALGLDIEILDDEEMLAKGMNALVAVGQGSACESRLITLKYNGAGDAPYAAYVGKGITFDSGGISIKPDDNMGEMKDDMTGSACVLGAIRAIAKMQLPVNIMAVLACAENMPSSLAQRPGDIVRAANGKTIEVVSTDAEGRMVLADAVYYACQQGAQKVIDIATLTGGVMVALGTKTSGIITNDEALGAELVAAGKRVGESLFVLPSLPELKEAIKSEVADLRNSTGRYGSCITGGLFIGEFIKQGIPWAHIDIGGTSTVTETKGFKPIGGTAFGTMTLIKMADNFMK